MREIMERFRQEAEDNRYSEITDRDFHMSIARASGNHMYMVMCDMVWKAMKQRMWSLILSRTVTAEENRKQHYKEHMEIAQAILDGKSELAYNYMKAAYGGSGAALLVRERKAIEKGRGNSLPFFYDYF